MNLLVFAGTTEGTDFAKKALEKEHTVTVSVATEYGSSLIQKELSAAGTDLTHLHVLHGRLSADEIASVAAHFDAIVDATHPYASEVTANLLAASSLSFVPYFRLQRKTDCDTSILSSLRAYREFDTMEELARSLSKTQGNIFVSTGSRDLDFYKIIPDYAERLFVRVLPSAESIEKCRAAGFDQSHIIAMQGAFSAELNRALFSEYGCRILVTKKSGKAGGFLQKIEAACGLGMEVYALKAPAEQAGFDGRVFSSPEEVLSALQETDLFGPLADFLEDEK